ncbi:YybH family protein [Bacteroides graminisolvens]|uniref:YybH family protein n=1 Tax=Bacteroides graminisolvens TaxID=477666 RepID=UPI001D0525A6|nr:nuclear transport factor 2 family protein [Bacteroides graminisolvens]
MSKQNISETIIALEKAAMQAWLNGNPSPFLALYSKDFTYFDPSLEWRLDDWNKIEELYESMRGKAKIDQFEMINPVVQSTDTMAVLTYNLHIRLGICSGKKIVQRCIVWKTMPNGKLFIATFHPLSLLWSERAKLLSNINWLVCALHICIILRFI